MQLRRIVLEGFRGYNKQTAIDIEDFTAFVGRNDAGKSSVFDALDAFFNGVTLSFDDICKYSSNHTIRISCVFSDLPERIVIDSDSPTSLRNEYLLNNGGDLEIMKEWIGTSAKLKEKVFCIAEHPEGESLLSLKITDLKKKAKDLGIDEKNYKKDECHSIREAIRNQMEPLNISRKKIEIGDKSLKNIWEELQKYLPTFALFKSDRSSTDADSEAQDPMMQAVKQTVKDVHKELEEIRNKVNEKLVDVATRTLDELREISPEIEKTIVPKISPPKWESVFKISLSGENDIPLNKMGSGTRRLVLLSFFRAEVKRKLSKEESNGTIIYAIEEPETSQHPDNVRIITETLKELAYVNNTQVMITTHIPAMAELLSIKNIRFVEKNGDSPTIKAVTNDGQEFLKDVASSLGVYPEIGPRCKVVILVEGPTDISFLENVSATISEYGSDLPRICRDNPDLAILPTGGGGVLKHWVEEDYLKALNLPKICIFDRDGNTNSSEKAERINSKDNGNITFVTIKREIENYIHPDAIKNCSEGRYDISIGDDTDVPAQIKSLTGWKESHVKKWLCTEAAKHMTYEMIMEIDKEKEMVQD
jgi:predicted ATP-dependent endonuclease of OLD family